VSRAPLRDFVLPFAFIVAAACGTKEQRTQPAITAPSVPSASPSSSFARDAAEREEARSVGSAAIVDAGNVQNTRDSEAPTDAIATIPEDMLPVPGGAFTMGADRGGQDDEHPAHTVTLKPFLLDRTEVTNADYAKCVAAHVCRPNSGHIASATKSGSDAEFTKPKRPVVGVAWVDARDYCAWRGKRLPREAEYERAVRGDDGRMYPWGNEPPTPARTVFGRDLGTGTTDDVGAHPEGRGQYGHDDLAGNVWEWMDDLYDPYAYRRSTAAEGTPGTCAEITAAQNELRSTGKQGFTGSNPIPTECERSIRGGAFNYDGFGLRSTNRVHHPAGFRLVMLGIRCAKDARP
jgi:formylglycine-generating enzyme required for sulfatase activity